MNIDSVRELKQKMLAVPAMAKSLAMALPAQPAAMVTRGRNFSIGVAPRGKDDFVLAVRVQSRAFEHGPEIAKMRKDSKGEIDIRYVGRISRRAIPWQQKRVRPLRVGVSVAHFKVTAGTLGCFVTDPKDGSTYMLSNNHVLANENRAKKGDRILQPGPFDNGVSPADAVAKLERFVSFSKSKTNLVDCAIARLDAGTKINKGDIKGLGKLGGVGDATDGDGGVAKLGRTTGLTRGRVTAFEIDNVVVSFDIGDLRFDNQIEIEGAGEQPFSQGGDSGSLIVDESMRGVGLLFAGSDQGGANNQGLTYANPLRAVLQKLKVDLLF